MKIRPAVALSALAATALAATAACSPAPGQPDTPAAAAAAILNDLNDGHYQAAWRLYAPAASPVTEQTWQKTMSSCPHRVDYTIGRTLLAGDDAAMVEIGYTLKSTGWFSARADATFSFTRTPDGWHYAWGGQTVYDSHAGKPCAVL
jgi:hypothetical protein